MAEGQRIRTFRHIRTPRDRFRQVRAKGMRDVWDGGLATASDLDPSEIETALAHERERFAKQDQAVARMRGKLLGMRRKLSRAREKNMLLGAYRAKLEQERRMRENEGLAPRAVRHARRPRCYFLEY